MRCITHAHGAACPKTGFFKHWSSISIWSLPRCPEVGRQMEVKQLFTGSTTIGKRCGWSRKIEFFYRHRQHEVQFVGVKGQQAEERRRMGGLGVPKAGEDTHREWCEGTSCLWSPAGVCGPGSLSGTAGWGSDADQYSTPFLEEETETSGSVRQSNHAGGHLHSFTAGPHPSFDFEAIKKPFRNLNDDTPSRPTAWRYATSLQ